HMTFASRFCRAVWKDGYLLLREHGGKVAAFDPLSAPCWNALLADEGLTISCPERLPDGSVRVGGGTGRELERIARAAAALLASGTCRAVRCDDLQGDVLQIRRFDADDLKTSRRARVTGATANGRELTITVEATAAQGRVVGIERR